MKPPIKELLEHYGATFVPESNRWRKMKCPFHGDRNASATVNTETQAFRCFACDFSGDGFDLLIWRGDASDFSSAKQEATRILGDEYGGIRESANARHGRRKVFDRDARPISGQRSILSAGVRRKPLAGA